MIFQDSMTVFYWWVILAGFGLLSFPIAFVLLDWLWDKGWGFSKILSMMLLSYWVWFLGSLKLLRFNQITMWLGLFGLAFVSYNLFLKHKKKIIKFIASSWRLLVFEELLFGLVLWSWSLVRAHQPDINGLEKFMDFGFVNSIIRSDFFPPQGSVVGRRNN